MKLNEMFPSNFLKAQDVTDAGGEMVCKIASVEMKQFDNDDGGKENKPALTFADEKQLILNKTNANTIAALLGDDTADWIGKEITLIQQEVTFKDKLVPAIRVKNLSKKDVLIQEYWTKTREMGMTRPEGLAHLKEFGNDFEAALIALNPVPTGADADVVTDFMKD